MHDFDLAHLDLHLVEGLSVVDPDDGSRHLRDDDHVPQVGLDHVRLLVGRALLLLLAQLLDESHRLALQTAGELAPETLTDLSFISRHCTTNDASLQRICYSTVDAIANFSRINL